MYGATGQIGFVEVQTSLSGALFASKSYSYVFIMSLVFILTGIGFKFATVPYHAWAPDVYQGAPLSSTLFLASIPKIAVFAILIRVLVDAFPILVNSWQTWLFVVALLSIVTGNLVALAQTNIRRLLAYSAIAHMGFMLLGVAASTASGYSASLFYLLIYVIMTIGAFASLVALSSTIDIQEIADLQGLHQRNPTLAFVLMLILFSMAGLPPLAGFFAKIFVLKAIFEIGYIKIAIGALFMTIIGVYYYIRIIRVMYFESPIHTDNILISGATKVKLTINGLFLIFIGLFPMLLMQYCQSAFVL